MEVTNIMSDFKNFGYFIHDIENLDEIIASRKEIADYFRISFAAEGSDEFILNNAHNIVSHLNDVQANKIVLELIQNFKQTNSMSNLVYNSSRSVLNSLFGMDIACQKNPNIVFQYPGSLRYSELHTDAPNNSPFELVYWLPLVDCYGTKSFYILDYSSSKDIYTKFLDNNFEDWSSFKDEALRKSTHLEINFGQILGFWSGLLHGSLLNETNESRFSYNVRFKNLYAPHGKKDPLVFYDLLNSSPLTHFAMNQ